MEAALVAKLVTMSVLFVASLALGSIPIKLYKWLNLSHDDQNPYVRLLLCFGGGVLMCTTFLHMQPEVQENIEAIPNFPDLLHIPASQLLMCVGFFAMYLVEELVHWHIHRSAAIEKGDKKVAQIDAESCNDHHMDHSHADASKVAGLRGLLIVLALSIHELFEGFAIGLEDLPEHVWYMFGAVSAHKLVLAFCLGMELVASRLSTAAVLWNVLGFAVVSPFGIGVGALISDQEGDAASLPSVILQGLASGTLLYVLFFEILRDERKGGLLQWLAVVVGFAVMLGITMISDHGHGDEGGGEEGHDHKHFMTVFRF